MCRIGGKAGEVMGRSYAFWTGLLPVLFLLLSGSAITVSAQTQGEILPLGREVKLVSEVLGEERTLWVHTPPGYQAGEARFPVLYLLDGEFTFPFTVGMVDFLTKTHRIPDLLVVGIVNVNRTRDYTPEPGMEEAERYPGSGGAHRFLRFLEEELVPWVDASYRTQPYRILAGHSHGGLFTAHAFVEDAPFQGFIASSPSVFWNQMSQVKTLEKVLAGAGRRPESLFLSMGSEREEMMAGIHAFTQVLEAHDPQWLTWRYQHMEGKDHEEMPFPSFFEGLEFTFLPYRDPSPIRDVGFQGYRQSLRDRYRYDLPLPLGVLFSGFALAQKRSCRDMTDMLRYWHETQPSNFRRFTEDWLAEGKARLERGESGCAVDIFRIITEADPENYHAHRGLGDALMGEEDRTGALASYRKALELWPQDEGLRELVERLARGGTWPPGE